MPSRLRIGPLTTSSGAGPLVDCQAPPWEAGSPFTASQAASTSGKYSGRQPAMTALTAAWATVTRRLRCDWAPMTSSGSRSTVARNSATSSSVAGTTGRPSLQPRS